MSTTSPTKLRVLIADPYRERRDRFVDFLEASGMQADIVETDVVAGVLSYIQSEAFALSIFGCGFDDFQLAEILAQISKHKSAGAIVVEARSTDKRLAQSLTQAGAHGVFAPPITGATFIQAVRRALRHGSAKDKISEHPTGSFPVVTDDSAGPERFSALLGQFSERLAQIARRLESEEAEGRSLSVSPKLIKEALLSVVSTVDDDSEEAIEKVVMSLYKEQ